jgi:hypothetical protein
VKARVWVKKESGSCDGLAFFIWECCARAGERGQPGGPGVPAATATMNCKSAPQHVHIWLSVGG